MKHLVVAPTLFACLISLAALAQTSLETVQPAKSQAAKVSRAVVSPALKMTAGNASPSRGEVVRFSAAWNRRMPQMTYHFDFGDGQFADTQEPVAEHTYARTGTYAARVSGRAVTQTAVMLPPSYASNDVIIQVNQTASGQLPLNAGKPRVPKRQLNPDPFPPPATVPQLTLTANHASPALNQSVHFTGTWSQNVYRMQYVFDWGDGQTTGTAEPAADHTYTQPGTYTVRLSATSLTATHAARVPSITSNELLITIAQPASRSMPRLTLSADSLNPQAGDTVHFTGRWIAPKYPPSAYRFEWGDDQVSETATLVAQHAYRTPGSYRVRVTAIPLRPQGSEVVSNEVMLSVTRRPVPPPPSVPVLTLSADQLAPVSHQRVHFTTAWDHSVSGARYSYIWGDGGSSESDSAHAYHSYSAPGNYSVRVFASGIANDRQFDARSNEVTIAVSTPPTHSTLPEKVTASLKVDHQNSQVGESLSFTASVSVPSAGVQYHFVFGDGNTQDSLANEVTYSYSRPGEFRPWVTVFIPKQDGPITSPAILMSVAGKPPRLNVTLKTEKLLAGRDVVLQASLDPPHENTTYEFDWGDRSAPVRVDSRGVASHRYAEKGQYPVVVTASTEEVYATPVQQRLVLVITRPFWPFTLLEWIIILAVVGIAIGAVQVLRSYFNRTSTPIPEFHVHASLDLGVHNVTCSGNVVPHFSITLKPGMGLADSEITLYNRAAASD